MGMIESTQNQQRMTEFNTRLQDAIAQPANANLNLLWHQLELVLSNLPEEEVLKVAGDAIAQLALICAARATLFLEDWQTRYNPPFISLVEPVLSDDLLAGVLRQTMSLNLENLLEEADPQRRSERLRPEDSVVLDVEKAAVLEMLDQIELKQAALHIAYEESISEWSVVVLQWVNGRSQPVSLATILSNVELPPVRIWLGLLLANPSLRWEHQWKTEEEFYDPNNIWLQGYSTSG